MTLTDPLNLGKKTIINIHNAFVDNHDSITYLGLKKSLDFPALRDAWTRLDA